MQARALGPSAPAEARSLKHAWPSGRALALRRLAASALCLALALPQFAACGAHAYRGERRPKPAARAVNPPAQRAAEDPLQIVVSVEEQRLFVYDRLGLLDASAVSTGVGGYPTPTGIFSVLDKEWQHYSNIYGAAPMPFMQRLTMSGVALHAGLVTGRPASHGCIRVPRAFAVKLYKLTNLGTRVVIASNAPAPEEITHARLFVRRPPPPAATADPNKPLAVARATAAELDKGIADARLGNITAERWRTLEALPISIFVSGKEGRLFVRHGFRPLFDAPVSIRAPERPLGTHLFTALDYRDAAHTVLRWQVVSLPPEPAPTGRLAAKPMPIAARVGEELAGADAAAALDRIALPQEAVDRIAELIAPGAALIVSDHGWNREMRAEGTDFIVLTH